MATSTDKPREAARATPMVLRSRAVQTTTAPANPSPLRQVRAVGNNSDTSQVTDADFIPVSASAITGQDSTTIGKLIQGAGKRPRTEEFLGDRDEGHSIEAVSQGNNCSGHVANVLSEERRMYEAKMKLFQDCAAAVDNTLNKAGTDLYPCAKEFGAFFAKCLQAWLKGSDPFIDKPKALFAEPTKTYAQGGEYGNALYAASSGGHDQVVQMLLEKGTDVNVSLRDGGP